jgi:hypothetical protein
VQIAIKPRGEKKIKKKMQELHGEAVKPVKPPQE